MGCHKPAQLEVRCEGEDYLSKQLIFSCKVKGFLNSLNVLECSNFGSGCFLTLYFSSLNCKTNNLNEFDNLSGFYKKFFFCLHLISIRYYIKFEKKKCPHMSTEIFKGVVN